MMDKQEGLKVKESILYTDDGMVASTYPGWLQTVFDTLTGLFDQDGLKTNFGENMGMVCHPCQAARVRSDKACTWGMTEARRSYKERQRERFSCPEFGKYLTRGSLDVHCQAHHGVTKGGPAPEGDGEVGGDKPSTYRISFPTKARTRH